MNGKVPRLVVGQAPYPAFTKRGDGGISINVKEWKHGK
jgi:hypothetical protein